MSKSDKENNCSLYKELMLTFHYLNDRSRQYLDHEEYCAMMKRFAAAVSRAADIIEAIEDATGIEIKET